MHMNFLTKNHDETFKKASNTVIYIHKSKKINWLPSTHDTKISNRSIIPLTNASSKNVLIIDDTLFKYPNSKDRIVVSLKGFRLLRLGWR